MALHAQRSIEADDHRYDLEIISKYRWSAVNPHRLRRHHLAGGSSRMTRTKISSNKKQARGQTARTFVAGFVVLGAPLAAMAQAAPSQLPNGASSISESYQDWQMVCTQVQDTKRCSVNQQQTDSKTNQRVLGVELQPQIDKAEGVLIMPFGLLLDKGVTLRIGEADIGSSLRFKTCLPQGCLVPLSLDVKALGALRKATTLTVNAAGANDQPMSLSISLKGFGQALDRAAVLAR